MQTTCGIYLAIFAMLCGSCAVEGTRCWICYQARSNRECIIRGFAKHCSSTEICENEVRYAGIETIITKRCKQKLACSNDQYQNQQISNNKHQCGTGRQNSVCRCCCDSDDCNKNSLTCANNDQPKCRYLYIPNGAARCYGSADRVSIGTRCRFNCRVGYEVIGADFVSCQRSQVGSLAVWSAQIPTCKKRPTCARLLSRSFTNGIVRCSGTTTVPTLGTACVFRCKPRYEMVDDGKRKATLNYEKTVCTMLRDVPTWSKRPPTCIAQMCPVATSIDHGFGTCTKSNKLGSVCTYSCFDGYDLVGKKDISCVQKAGYKDWDIRPPVCRPKPCPENTFKSPLLNVQCSHFNNFGSICSIRCRSGYYAAEMLRNPSMKSYTSTCGLRGKVIDWDLQAPTCVKKWCPWLRTPTGAEYACTNGVQHMSTCTFSCPAPERVVVGQPVITCADNGNQSSVEGVWTDAPPRCDYKQCSPLDLDTTSVDCSNGFVFGSVCTFSCKAGYHMVASDGISVLDEEEPTTTRCSLLNGEVEWTRSPPRCEKQMCLEIMTTPGMRVSCTQREHIGSQCSFECEEGFRITGKRVVECNEGPPNQILGRWSSPTPRCIRRSCPRINSDEESSDLTCTSGFEFESVCTLGCNEGYFMTRMSGTPEVIDRFKTTCLISNGRMVWSGRAPVCRPKQCNRIRNIANGRKKCSGELIFGAKCEFTCDSGYGLVGDQTVSCVDDDSVSATGRWSSPAPICEPKKCPELMINEATTRLNCGNGNSYGSKCIVRCKRQHFIRDKITNVNKFSTATTCIMKDNGDMVWAPNVESCQPVSCDAITDSALISKCSNGNETNSVCFFTCPTGYEIVGNKTNRCTKVGQYDASWRHPLPSCKARKCISLVSDGDMVQNCTRDNDYNSTCSFECQPGRGLFMTTAKDSKIIDAGVAESKCIVDTKGAMGWTGVLPKCHEKYCSVRRKPKNGKIRCTLGSKFRSRCTYFCNGGFKWVGGTRFTRCLEGRPNSPQGEWSAPPGTCEFPVAG